MRGVLHEWAALAALAGGVLLVATAPRSRSRAAAAVFAASLAAQFAVSATYHRRTWGARGRVMMRRFDHAAIFVLIAGTYTPICLLALEPRTGNSLLAREWTGAGAGVVLSMAWPGAPRLLRAALYLGLGWMILPHARQAAEALGAARLSLVALGGVLYSLGAAVYVARKPDLLPRVFGYHELFHAFTIAASAAHGAVVASLVRRT